MIFETAAGTSVLYSALHCETYELCPSLIWHRYLCCSILLTVRHVILDVCCPDGQARRTIVRRKGPFPGAYNASKKLSWGDLYPFPLELTTDEEAKLRAAMGDQYTTPDSEIVRRERRRLRALRQASERQHEQEATAILRQRSAELSPEEMLEEEMMNEHVVEEEVSDRFAKDERQMLRERMRVRCVHYRRAPSRPLSVR